MMDEAYAFMLDVSGFPVAECGEGMVSLIDAAKDANVEVTFSDRPHADRCRRLFYLREGLIGDFLNVAQAMNRLGWVLHVEDAFRTTRMQRGLARQPKSFEIILKRIIWELGGEIPSADFVRRRVAALIASAPNVGTHMFGSAIDISVFRRGDLSELNRAAAYLAISELTPMDSPFINDEARGNRRKITEVFRQEGFVAYPWEFWHYSKGDAFDGLLNSRQEPARYGPIDFDPDTGRIKPIENAAEPLVSLGDIERRIAETLAK